MATVKYVNTSDQLGHFLSSKPRSWVDIEHLQHNKYNSNVAMMIASQ